jgi:hypothetical protein
LLFACGAYKERNTYPLWRSGYPPVSIHPFAKILVLAGFGIIFLFWLKQRK